MFYVQQRCMLEIYLNIAGQYFFFAHQVRTAVINVTSTVTGSIMLTRCSLPESVTLTGSCTVTFGWMLSLVLVVGETDMSARQKQKLRESFSACPFATSIDCILFINSLAGLFTWSCSLLWISDMFRWWSAWWVHGIVRTFRHLNWIVLTTNSTCCLCFLIW